MTPVNPFILKNKEKMVNFLDELSVSQQHNSLCTYFFNVLEAINKHLCEPNFFRDLSKSVLAF